MDIKKIGEQIAYLRKSKEITQNELGERLGVSFQAVSKWERGENLPDITLLPDLARILGVSIDTILTGDKKATEFKGSFSVSDMIKRLNHLKGMGESVGNDNLLYRAAIDGINTSLNTDIEKAFTDDYVFEAFLAEAIIQNLIAGKYIDVSDIKNNFKHEHFKNIVLNYCKKHNII